MVEVEVEVEVEAQEEEEERIEAPRNRRRVPWSRRLEANAERVAKAGLDRRGYNPTTKARANATWR